MKILILSLLLATWFTHPFAVVAESTPPISSRVTVVGAVYCDTCLSNGFSKYSYFIPGAEVHIQCKINANSPKTAEMISFSVNRTTDNNGIYKLEIPSVDGVDCVDGPPLQSFCQATLIGSSSECNVPALKTTANEISVKSRQENLCVYSFTPLSFRPSKRDNTLCRKQTDKLSDSESSSKFFLPRDFSWPNLPTSSILQAFGLPFTSPPSLPFPFASPPPSLPFPFPHLPNLPTPSPPSLPFPFSSPPPSLPFPFPHLPPYPSIPPLFHSPPPPSFNLGDPTTWIPHIPLISPLPPPPPAFNLGDPSTWRPLFPPSNPQRKNP